MLKQYKITKLMTKTEPELLTMSIRFPFFLHCFEKCFKFFNHDNKSIFLNEFFLNLFSISFLNETIYKCL